MSKADAATSAALAALGIGTMEQKRRMAEPSEVPVSSRRQLSMRLTKEGVAMLCKAQGKLLERGVEGASTKGVALEIVMAEWLALQC